ncbi:hypothetical protein I5J35_gp32 [Mycobacterium phage Rem711]|uniref:Uncharacterized protein n=1 Tax=Mycobacterium phage Rem711 TaxID=2079285 RepID=A0A2K9VEX2_9CAUD|nr:hypothetical protein I5J35_gp32 [Mycobacterium phage Rem711]AUV60810.1 hypothetical protein SEA_REM711_32 [Mycobacterium phage Rem711]
MTSPTVATPALRLLAWPAWVGLCEHVLDMPVEPLANLEYRRGQIFWRHEAGRIIGGGRVYVPGGIRFDAIVFSHTPAGDPLGYAPLNEPLLYRSAAFVDIDPITNGAQFASAGA